MERVDMLSKNQYLKVLREEYFKAKTRKQKSQILDEYRGNTGQARKYAMITVSSSTTSKTHTE